MAPHAVATLAAIGSFLQAVEAEFEVEVDASSSRGCKRAALDVAERSALKRELRVWKRQAASAQQELETILGRQSWRSSEECVAGARRAL